MDKKQYIAIDLKSFYASVECKERELDPLDACLVVADASRTEKTICLAVSPALKSFGIGGRARLFEALQRIREVNADRKASAGITEFEGKSTSGKELQKNPALEVDCIIAKPRMQLYMDYSTRIYEIYLRYVAPEDMHIYSVDEVFLDMTPYLAAYGKTAHEMARIMIGDVLRETGITATAGIGTNLYLCKIAMDIVAKHMPADQDGVRIAELDEISYRKALWEHQPLTDFWRIGQGTARTLAKHGMVTMGDVARCSLGGEKDYWNGELLYKLFGINAELLIDHAWGYEPCTMADIKKYRPANNSFSSGQVLSRPYGFAEARVVLQEMADAESMKLVARRLMTDQLVLDVNYDTANLADEEHRRTFKGEVSKDWYGRTVPARAHGSWNLSGHTSSTKEIMEAAASLFDQIVDPALLIRRMNITVNHVITEEEAARQNKKKQEEESFRQMDLFSDFFGIGDPREPVPEEKKMAGSGKAAPGEVGLTGCSKAAPGENGLIGYGKAAPGEVELTGCSKAAPGENGLIGYGKAVPGEGELTGSGNAALEQKKDRNEDERHLQEAMLAIRRKYGKNAVLRGLNFREGATMRERNSQIGGHKA